MQQSQIIINQEHQDIINKLKQSYPNIDKTQSKNKLQQRKDVKIVTFTREVDHFYCDFTLENDQILKIVLTSQIDATVYELIIGKQQKKQHEELNFFQSIEEIYEYLMENTEQGITNQDNKLVKVQQNGKISIKVISTIGKKERQRTINLSPLKIQQNKDVYLQNVVKKISKTLIDLKKQVVLVKEKQESLLKMTSDLFEKIKSYGHKMQFTPDKNDSHYCKFKELDRRITKTTDNTTYFSIYGETPIAKQGTSYFNMKIINTNSKNLLVGLGSKFTKGIPNVYSHDDFIGFYTYGEGYVWEKSNQRDLHIKEYPIENGITITTNVNMDRGYINWEICGVRVAYAVIPLELKSKQLFPVILMMNVNDMVQIDP